MKIEKLAILRRLSVTPRLDRPGGGGFCVAICIQRYRDQSRGMTLKFTGPRGQSHSMTGENYPHKQAFRATNNSNPLKILHNSIIHKKSQ